MLSARFFLLSASLRTRISVKRFQTIQNLVTPLVNSTNINNQSQNKLRLFSTEQFAGKDPDVFGDIAGDKYERFELDEDEKKIDEYEKNEHRPPRRLRKSPGQYADLIKKHINRKDLKSAMGVLDLVKENRDKPTYYMYNLLIRAFSVQGDLKKCLKLYNDMKKRSLPVNGATYTSVINACANSDYRGKALEALEKLRQEFLKKSVVLGEAHYNAMIKAYGKHQLIVEAFTLVDEMMEKKMSIGEGTFNSLMFASISDKENGLKHTLTVWHLMNRWRIKPTIITYNLLLRAFRDTKFGGLKINDILIKGVDSSKIQISDNKVPDLLANPPIVSNLLLTSGEKTNTEESSKNTDTSLLPAVKNIDTDINLDFSEVHKNNKLILFGGYTGFMERMEKDGVQPDVRTITLMMSVIPDSLSIENNLIQIARTKKISLDIDFYNMLIKKRSFRKDYKQAKAVLDEIRRNNLHPDIITWGVLALGCQTREDARALLDGMDATGNTLNTVIAGTLIANACHTNQIPYILEIMHEIRKERIRPSRELFTIIDNFIEKMKQSINENRHTKRAKTARYKENFLRFQSQYKKWQESFPEETSETRSYRLHKNR